MKRIILAFLILSLGIIHLILYPNSPIVNQMIGYRLYQLDREEPIQSFKRADQLSLAYLDLYENGEYVESEQIIYWCGTGLDETKGPWNEIGEYEIVDGILLLFPRIIQEQRNLDVVTNSLIFQRKFSIPRNRKRKLMLLPDSSRLLEKETDFVYQNLTPSRSH
ncbi:MAG: hypothetical protein AAF587_32600 [Bacteroidota bacterium]